MKKVITICSSVSFYKDVLGIEKQLKKNGFKVIVPFTAKEMGKRGDFNVSKHKTWLRNKSDYRIKTKLMDQHFKKVVKSDIILVVNKEKNGISGYIGGNTLMEMTLAYHYKKPIYLLHGISHDLPLKEEVFAINPIVINNDLSRIK